MKTTTKTKSTILKTTDLLSPVCHTDARRDLYWKTFDRRRWGYLRWATGVVREGLRSQVQPVIDKLDANTPLAADTIGQTIRRDPMMEAVRSIYGRVGGAFAKDVFDGLAGRKQEQNSEEDFTEAMIAWFGVNGIARIAQITNTTTERVQQAVEQAVSNNLSVRETAKRIRQNAIVSKRRAKLIARTEIISASNRGSLMGAQRIGVAQRKEWLATPDERTRPHHRTADGQTRPLNEPFRVMGEELMFPGDPSGSPTNIINCRCTLTYKIN